MSSTSDSHTDSTSPRCSCSDTGCEASIPRRDLLKLGGALATSALLSSSKQVMAGPFDADDVAEHLVPADKKLSEEWIRSLFERGAPDWFTGEELKHIGMPVGGICCGQVYLSGDGRLWHWDIFNHDVAPRNRTAGPHYAKPMSVASAVDLGFTIRVRTNSAEMVRSLDQAGFPQVRFRGAYPIGFVDFRDDAFPVEVSLEAFSPFSPLDVDGSSLPLTVMRYTVRNSSEHAVDVSLAGTLTNPILIHSGNGGGADFVNRIVKRPDATCMHCTAKRREEVAAKDPRPDILFEDFESDTYENWTVEGTAFGSGPVIASQMPAYQGKVGAAWRAPGELAPHTQWGGRNQGRRPHWRHDLQAVQDRAALYPCLSGWRRRRRTNCPAALGRG